MADLGLWETKINYVVEPGEFLVWVGSSSSFQRHACSAQDSICINLGTLKIIYTAGAKLSHAHQSFPRIRLQKESHQDMSLAAFSHAVVGVGNGGGEAQVDSAV